MSNQYSGLSLVERFENKVELIPESTCHWWNACLTQKGYGQISVNGKMLSAHRVAYELYNDKITDELHVLHKCDNPGCVNPDHLFLGTNADNVKDRDSKGRQAKLKGELNGSSKLSDSDVMAIKLSSKSQSELARNYGVSHKLIWNILHHKSWTHVA